MTDPNDYMKPSLVLSPLPGESQQLKDIQNQLTLIDYKLNHVLHGIEHLFDFIQDKIIDRLGDEL